MQTFLDALPIAREKSFQVIDGDQPLPHDRKRPANAVVRSSRNFYSSSSTRSPRSSGSACSASRSAMRT